MWWFNLVHDRAGLNSGYSRSDGIGVLRLEKVAVKII